MNIGAEKKPKESLQFAMLFWAIEKYLLI